MAQYICQLTLELSGGAAVTVEAKIAVASNKTCRFTIMPLLLTKTNPPGYGVFAP
jgi:hypothetical protein